MIHEERGNMEFSHMLSSSRSPTQRRTTRDETWCQSN